MSARTSGTLVEVIEEIEGSSLVAAAVVGATVLTIAETSDFGDEGTCRISGTDYAYTVDHETLTLTIGPGLTAAAEEGDEVQVLNHVDQPESAWYARVDIDEDEDADLVDAVIRTGLRPYFTLGESDAGALVDLESDDEGWVVVSRPYDRAEIDAATVKSAVLTAYRPNTANVGTGGTGGTINNWTVSSQTTEVIYFEGSGVFRVTEPGHYGVIAVARWDSNAVGRRMVWPVWLRSSGEKVGHQDSRPADDTPGFTNHITDLEYLEAGEGLLIKVFQSSGGGLALLGGPTQSTTTVKIYKQGP